MAHCQIAIPIVSGVGVRLFDDRMRLHLGMHLSGRSGCVMGHAARRMAALHTSRLADGWQQSDNSPNAAG